MNKKTAIWSLAVLAVILFASCGNNGGNMEMPKVKFETKVLKHESRTYNMSFPATLEGTTEVKIYPQVEGIIKVKNFTNGTRVHKGQTLFVIDPTEYRLGVQSAEANLSAAKAQMETTKLQYESNQELFNKKVISDYVLKTSLNAYNAAKAAVMQAEAQLNIARTNLGYCTVTSPLNGYIASNGFDVGDLASRMAYLCQVSDNNVVDANFSISENQLLEITKEFQLKVTNKGLEGPGGKLLGDALPALKLQLKDGSMFAQEGKVTKMDAIVQQSTGTVTCTGTFPNPDGVLRSGLSANVVIPLSSDSVLCVPQTAAIRLQDQMMFYRVKSDGTVEGILCHVFPSNDGTEYYILDGLHVGDEIVTNGARKLSNGMKIR
ncbi:MAG: efflux RND transporter periplasmic adaptor subunit [Bacteroidales bacterium]|nr:efflux RND transporter periplasmic adaptor subunit [Bacteroidales bacterium]MDY6347417.1 efflux RND transporter periplasmic adaptor subunit [Bacteroidales bacterium]